MYSIQKKQKMIYSERRILPLTNTNGDKISEYKFVWFVVNILLGEI